MSTLKKIWTVIKVSGMAILIFGLSNGAGQLIYQLGLPVPVAHLVGCGLTLTLTLYLTLLTLNRFSKLTPHNLRISRPTSWKVWGGIGLILPLVVTGFYLLFTEGTYTSSTITPDKTLSLTFYTLCIAGVGAGVGEEFLFRGVIMGIIEKEFNLKVAILFPSILFGLLHASHLPQPTFLDLSLLLIGGTAVGVMFSLIALQSRSIWTSAWVHSVWNICMIGSFVQVGIKEKPVIFFSYILSSSERWLTGGGFGIEAGAPATCAYLLVAGGAWYLYTKDSQRSLS